MNTDTALAGSSSDSKSKLGEYGVGSATMLSDPQDAWPPPKITAA